MSKQRFGLWGPGRNAAYELRDVSLVPPLTGFYGENGFREYRTYYCGRLIELRRYNNGWKAVVEVEPAHLEHSTAVYPTRAAAYEYARARIRHFAI